MSHQNLLDLKTLLIDYERDSGQSIYDGYDISQFLLNTVNDVSKLVLCVIRALGGQLSMRDIDSYFADHLVCICMKYENKKQSSMILYDPTVHQLDPEAQLTHQTVDDRLVCVRIQRDSNCLWSAVSLSIHGSDKYMESLRLLTASTLLDYRQSFEKSYKSSDITYDELVDKAVTLGEWDHELHIQALSLALHRPIYMYSSFGSLVEPYRQTYDQLRESYESMFVYYHMRFLADSSCKDEIPVLLYYNGFGHYSPILVKREDVWPLKPFTEIMKPMF
ncbi:uncharacterized protein LOC128951527 [Oppia nitens]|uniref:uncharacterized protein LOC128951527 n=1 Tax=Oppia nitens TaxID=1686743 RepID=UPI0023DA520D|nr:uncharacterized protein LOC128951527 [Oppia nitens]